MSARRSPSSVPTTARRLAPLALVMLLALALGGCRQVDQLLGSAPRVIAPGGPAVQPTVTAPGAGLQPADLPAEQPAETYTIEALEPDADGTLRYRVRIEAGGSPSHVADDKLTPLFQVDGKNAAQYVSDAYFQANPGRTPRTIQPGDEFELRLPPDTFIVRWQQERVEDIGGSRVNVREYISERGDRLFYYETVGFPILYELEPAGSTGEVTVRLHPDLAYLLGSGRLDPVRLARLVYRVPDPDLMQVGAMRQLGAEVQPGQSAELTIDRTRTYLDPVREAMKNAAAIEPVPEPGRDHLTRAIFTPDQGSPYLAIEDAIGTRTDISELPPGEVFRIEYGWDGTVRVSYLTGDDDGRGKRDPYHLRENERWAALYDRLAPGDTAPVMWGPGQASDLPPFPTARDPYRRVQDGERSYDYLIPGRAILLTFRPTRSQADARAQAEFRAALRSLREEYHDDLTVLIELIGLSKR